MQCVCTAPLMSLYAQLRQLRALPRKLVLKMFLLFAPHSAVPMDVRRANTAKNSSVNAVFSTTIKILSTANEISKSSPAHNVATRCFLLLALTHILRNYDYTNPTSELTTSDTMPENSAGQWSISTAILKRN